MNLNFFDLVHIMLELFHNLNLLLEMNIDSLWNFPFHINLCCCTVHFFFLILSFDHQPKTLSFRSLQRSSLPLTRDATPTSLWISAASGHQGFPSSSNLFHHSFLRIRFSSAELGFNFDKGFNFSANSVLIDF